jgi:hypothetical protein
MTPEALAKRDIKSYLDALVEVQQLRYFMPQNMGMGESGVADFVGVYRGIAFAIEAKRADGKSFATPWQWRFLCNWRHARGRAGVARNADDVHSILFTIGRPIDILQPDRVEEL